MNYSYFGFIKKIYILLLIIYNNHINYNNNYGNNNKNKNYII